MPGVVAVWAFDLDDVRAEIREHHARVRSCEHSREIGDPDAVRARRPSSSPPLVESFSPEISNSSVPSMRPGPVAALVHCTSSWVGDDLCSRSDARICRVCSPRMGTRPGVAPTPSNNSGVRASRSGCPSWSTARSSSSSVKNSRCRRCSHRRTSSMFCTTPAGCPPALSTPAASYRPCHVPRPQAWERSPPSSEPTASTRCPAQGRFRVPDRPPRAQHRRHISSVGITIEIQPPSPARNAPTGEKSSAPRCITSPVNS